jgi:hypothetical protein
MGSRGIDDDKGKRLGRAKKIGGYLPESRDAATAGASAAATAVGSNADANRATAPKEKKKHKSKSVAAAAAAAPTAKDIEDAKKFWSTAYDGTRDKYYYYQKETKEVCWDKPLGYDEAHGVVKDLGGGTKDVTGTKKTSGLMGLGKKLASAKESNDTPAPAPNADGNTDHAKFWRETMDGTTNKVYYYNKKTKEVSWTRPACLDVGKADEGKVDEVGSGTEKAEACVEVEGPSAAMTGEMTEKRKKSWFKRGGNVERIAKTDEKKAEKTPAEEDVMVADTILEDTLSLPVKETEPAWKKEDDANAAAPGDANAAAPGEVDDDGKNWRAAPDAITGKTYYFNKNTKAVTWVKPAGFKEKEHKIADSERMTAITAVEGGATSTVVKVVKVAAATAVSTVTAAAALASVEVQDPVGEPNGGIQNAAIQQPFTVDDLSAIEDTTDANVIVNHVRVQEDAPFDEPNAPFDEPLSRSMEYNQDEKCKKVVTLVPHQFEEQEDDDPQERQDSFDQFEGIPPPGHFLRLKSKSSDQLSRQRTYASHTTASTRKAANTRGQRTSSWNNLGKDDAATFDVSLNNSSIASDIFDDNHKSIQDSNKAKLAKLASVASANILRKKQKNELPQLLKTPPDTPPQKLPRDRMTTKTKGGNNRRYASKRAENLGDSSVDDSDEDDRGDDQYWSSDDFDDDADDVSALSGIGNESIESMKKKNDTKRKEINGNAHQKPSRSDNSNTWTQQELDLFISKNDWGSVAEYINEMRVNKGSGGNKPNAAVRKEPSIREIQKHIKDNRSLERASRGLHPKKKFGGRSEVQYDETTQDSPSADVESESLFHSLSSASDESFK